MFLIRPLFRRQFVTLTDAHKNWKHAYCSKFNTYTVPGFPLSPAFRMQRSGIRGDTPGLRFTSSGLPVVKFWDRVQEAQRLHLNCLVVAESGSTGAPRERSILCLRKVLFGGGITISLHGIGVEQIFSCYRINKLLYPAFGKPGAGSEAGHTGDRLRNYPNKVGDSGEYK